MFDLPKLDNLMTVKHYSILSAQKKKGTATTILLRSWRLICQPLPLFIQLVNLFCWVSLGSPETESRIQSRSPMVNYLFWGVNFMTYSWNIIKQNQTIQQSNTQIAEVSICSFYEELGSYLAVAGTVWCRARISILTHRFPLTTICQQTNVPGKARWLYWYDMRSCIFLTFIFTRLQISLLYPKPSNVL